MVLQPGAHDLQVVSETLQFRTTLRAEIVAGKTTRLTVPLPQGVIHINASPWAEVWIDGVEFFLPLWTTPLTIALGFLMLLLTMHMARGIGRMHGLLAKHLLVKIA